MEENGRKWTDYTDEEKLLVIDGYLDGVVALDDENENANKQRLEWLRGHIPAYKVKGGKNYIFVSYSHLDYKDVYKDLAAFSYNSQRRVRFWYDEGLPVGLDWEKAAGELIKNPHCVGVLFYLSKNLLLSPSVFKEIEYVKNLGKPYCTVALNDGFYSASKIFDEAKGSELRGVNQAELEAFFPDNNTALPYGIDNVLFRIDKIAAAFDVTEEVFSDFVCEEIDGGLELVAYRGNNTSVRIPEKIGDKSIVKVSADFPHAVSVYIPKTVKAVNRNVFDNADNLEEITVDKENPKYYDINGVLCEKNGKWIDGEQEGNLILRAPVCWDWKKQFENYKSVENSGNVQLYVQLQDIINAKEGDLRRGRKQSESEKKLKDLVFGKEFLSLNDRTYNDEYLDNFENLFSYIIEYLKVFGKQYVSDFGYAVIYKDIKAIYGILKKLKEFSVFKDESFISMDAFSGCRKLDYLFLSDSIKAIDCGAFENSSLRFIFLPADLKETTGGTFRNCTRLASVLTETDYYDTHDDSTFDKALLLGNLERITGGFENTGIKGIEFKEGIELRSCNFIKCNWLREVVVPGDTDSLYNAFAQCIRLRRVVLEGGVESLYNFCFGDCISLKYVKIPQTVEFIGETCFDGCENLEVIEYDGTVDEWFNLEEAVYETMFSESAWRCQGKGVKIICTDGVIEPSYED